MPVTRRHFLHGTIAAGLLALRESRTSAADDKPKSSFLEGNFGPVTEEITADDLKVVGTLPSALDGLFVRNGPNPQFPPKGRYHWFDGDGMLHGVRLRDGKASYRNRYVRTIGWEEERKSGKVLWGGLLDPPELLRQPPFKNTANTALVWHHGKLLALWEAGEPHRVGVPDLGTLGVENFDGKLNHAFTAHPKIDPTTGEMIFFGYSPLTPLVNYGVADRNGLIVRSTTIELPRPVMMHDFAISAERTIFMDLPETFSLQRALMGKPAFAFEPKFGARFGVLPRTGEGKDVKWFESEVCFVFHTLNAYDDGDAVVLLACRMKEFPAALEAGRAESRNKQSIDSSGSLYQWRFDLKTGKSTEGPLDDVPGDFPRVNEAMLGRKSRYGYVAESGNDLFSGLLKYDLEKGKSERHPHGKGRTGGEGVFVAKLDGKGEDDGWLLTFVHDAESGKSELVVIEAGDFTGKPVARVLLPQRVPYGFHGTWVPGTALNS